MLELPKVITGVCIGLCLQSPLGNMFSRDYVPDTCWGTCSLRTMFPFTVEACVLNNQYDLLC